MDCLTLTMEEAQVYHVVRQIPHAKVTSYGTRTTFLNYMRCMFLILSVGHIAKLIGLPSYSRHVGQGLYCSWFLG
jgi:methylated-DNA-protein-cysteine methyltransferase related protein